MRSATNSSRPEPRAAAENTHSELHKHPTLKYIVHPITRRASTFYCAHGWTPRARYLFEVNILTSYAVSDLVAFVFRDQFRAPEVLNELRRRDWTWVQDLDEAVAVTVNEDGKARVQLSVDPSTRDGARWARLWGSLLSATLFTPLTEIMVKAADGLSFSPRQPLDQRRPPDESVVESQWWCDSLEAASNFKRDVAALMAGNASAIFMLLRARNTAAVLRQLSDYGNTIVHTSLSNEQDEKLRKILANGNNSRQ